MEAPVLPADAENLTLEEQMRQLEKQLRDETQMRISLTLEGEGKKRTVVLKGSASDRGHKDARRLANRFGCSFVWRIGSPEEHEAQQGT